MNLEDANIIITGGANNIGRFLSEQLLKQCKNVIVIDKDHDAVSKLRNEYPGIKCFEADLTNVDEVSSIIDQIFLEINSINVLINNAGIIHSEPLINLISKDSKHSFTNWKNVIDINLNAVFYITVNVLEKMVKSRTKGVIINISSISGNGNAGQSAYSATKAAINALTVTWGKELGMFGIRCNAIAPGFMNTESTLKSLTESKIKAYKNSTPLGRLGKVEELLEAVQFIIKNDFYNCGILNLDGGLRI